MENLAYHSDTAMQRRLDIPENACCVIEGSVWEHKRDSSAAKTRDHGASALSNEKTEEKHICYA